MMNPNHFSGFPPAQLPRLLCVMFNGIIHPSIHYLNSALTHPLNRNCLSCHFQIKIWHSGIHCFDWLHERTDVTVSLNCILCLRLFSRYQHGDDGYIDRVQMYAAGLGIMTMGSIRFFVTVIDLNGVFFSSFEKLLYTEIWYPDPCCSSKRFTKCLTLESLAYLRSNFFFSDPLNIMIWYDWQYLIIPENL